MSTRSGAGLRMQKVVSKREGDALEVEAHLGLLIESALQGEAALQQCWDALPKSMQENVELLGAFIELALELGLTTIGERRLYASINRHWDDRLVYLFGMVEGEDPKRQLNEAEKWLSGREENALLLLTLGRLCIRNRLWGKARSYLDASLGLDLRSDSYRTLTELLDEIGETEEAAVQARNALSLTRSRWVFLVDSARARLLSREKRCGSSKQEESAEPAGEAPVPAIAHSSAGR